MSGNKVKIVGVPFNVVGVTFSNDDGTDRQEMIKNMSADTVITLKREPRNLYDTNAIAVYADGRQIGYIGKMYAQVLAPSMDMGAQFNVTVRDRGVYNDTAYCKIVVSEV